MGVVKVKKKKKIAVYWGNMEWNKNLTIWIYLNTRIYCISKLKEHVDHVDCYEHCQRWGTWKVEKSYF